jgi:hypothetical protein
VQEKLARLAERIAAPVSLRPCDAGTWDWRAYINSRTRVEG